MTPSPDSYLTMRPASFISWLLIWFVAGNLTGGFIVLGLR